ncbi:hypothetical protein V6N13_145190 [Hibiscus sabdariffa]|uniref:Uncharacterized protein n=1 Tax=Hibiscus sabdariffa TaxID=183260 RepID=A0ABR1ZEV0_9ROSI
MYLATNGELWAISLMGECWLGMQVIETHFRGTTTLAVTDILNGVSQDSRNLVSVRSICELCQRQLSAHIKHIQRSQCYSRPDRKIVEQQSRAHMLSTSSEGSLEDPIGKHSWSKI